MSASRRGADGFLFQVMLVLCALWGLQQVAIKAAAPSIVPMMQAMARSGIAALLVGLVMSWRGDWKHARGTLPAGLLTGVLFSLEFLFIALGLQYSLASHISVFLYTSPIFSALGLHLLLPSERLRLVQWVGIALCFGGIVVAFSGGVALDQVDARMLLGDAMGILGGAAWGATTVSIRASRLSEAPPTLTLFYQLAVAAVALLLLAAGSGQSHQVALTPLSVGSVLFQGVLVSFASYLTWFWLMRRYLASHLAVFSFMTPLFGVTFGVVLLDEPLSLNFVAGAGLVLLGIFLVNSEQWVRRLLSRPAVPRGPLP
jgi:drug/metabolite transporter (DMT)-like permease